ncbi:hypothetical protein Daesc_009013 [Daldinia eschscholtzii]|uniref:Uncharacterized protein n=1 Tax=Daldinia eschscholtzii TaxID=292717 RepID=A0AAX6M9S2_9PEZI
MPPNKFITYLFYKDQAHPKQQDRLRNLAALAYKTATDCEPHPKEIFIRGLFQKDPKGNHLTISHKNADQIRQKTHVTSHGYVLNKLSFKLKEATHSKMKPDSARKFRGGPVWPANNKTLTALKFGHSHLDS